MTKANTFSAKLFVGFVVTAMLFTLSFSPAKAATTDELQAQINALLAQIAALQGGSSSTGGSSTCTTFTMDQTMGSKGAEVTALQNFLIGKGHAIAAGATGFFGAQTKSALMAYQTAAGISPAAGYFGPITRAKVNADCKPTTTGGDEDTSTDDSDSSSDSLSGEASLDTTNLKDGDDTNIEEGQEDAPVADLELEFTDGDAKITRLDIALSATGEEDPWDTFEEVSLWVDGKEVARQNANSKDDYLDEDAGSIRFSGLDIVAKEDDKTTITIGVTVQDSVDNMPATWDVDTTALRFVDGDDVSSTETISEDAVSFDIDEQGSDDEVIVKSSTQDPDATTIAVDEQDKSDWTTIFAFDIDTDDSTNDIDVNHLKVGVITNGDNVAEVVSDMKLVIDGQDFDDYTWGGGTATRTADFDIDGDLTIDAGDRVTAELQVKFLKQSGNYAQGQTIYATTTGVSGDFEGADDVVGEGAATGETHTLRTEGAILEPGTMTTSIKANTDSTTADDEGVFTMKFDVTAFETDLWINKTAASGTAQGTAGVNFTVEDSNGNAVSDNHITASLSSTADTDGTQFKVSEGETETFTLTINFDPEAAGFYQGQLYSLNFKNVAGNPNVWQLAVPASDYETDQLSI